MAAKVVISGEYAQSLLQLIFNATTFTGIAINATSVPLANLYVSLHTANPSTTAGSGTVNTQNASEAAYAGYARVAVARATGSGGWTVTTNSVSPHDTIVFPAATGGSETESYFGIGTTPSGSGATVNITQSGGVISAVTINAAGSGYPASATIALLVTGGSGSGGIVAVTTGSSGTVTGYSSVLAGGSSYTSASGASTATNNGTAHLLYYGGVSPTIAVSNGVTPELTTSSTISES